MKKVFAYVFAIILIVSLLTVGAFATDYNDSGSWDFTTDYGTRTPWIALGRYYTPYTMNTSGKSEAYTNLYGVTTDFEVHQSYVCLYSIDNYSNANWSTTIDYLGEDHVFSGIASGTLGLYAKRVYHCAERSPNVYSYDTYYYMVY